MKRYIRASFDPSMPDWLRYAISNDVSGIKYGLHSKYGNRIAFDKMKVFSEPVGNDFTPIYKLTDNCGNMQVYIPGVNDGHRIGVIGGSIYKKYEFGHIDIDTIKSIAEDIVYVDLSDELNKYTPRKKYKDPRYNFDSEYAGQYYSDLDERWIVNDVKDFPRKRDKSGYLISNRKNVNK
jgi:hypothetical protein